jgi:chorismate-pyruvate lyase
MSAVRRELLEPLARLHGEVAGTFEAIESELVPEPFRSLLVHSGDMTSRLEAFHHGPVTLEVLQSLRSETEEYCREVILRRQGDRGAVEYGAIEIFLDAFEPGIRAKILEGTVPLGGLLNAHKVRYHSEPQAFFQLSPDESLARLLETNVGVLLYGRCNILRHDDGALIARIVEVLPPV